jgi:hypothetical protein
MGACGQRLGVQRQRRRLGISAVLDRGERGRCLASAANYLRACRYADAHCLIARPNAGSRISGLESTSIQACLRFAAVSEKINLSLMIRSDDCASDDLSWMATVERCTTRHLVGAQCQAAHRGKVKGLAYADTALTHQDCGCTKDNTRQRAVNFPLRSCSSGLLGYRNAEVARSMRGLPKHYVCVLHIRTNVSSRAHSRPCARPSQNRTWSVTPSGSQ